MINAVNSIRYFLFVSLCLQTSFGMTMEKNPMLFPQPLPRSTSSHTSSYPLGKGGISAVDIKKILLPINVNFFSNYFEHIRQMKLSDYLQQINVSELQARTLSGIKSHPKTFCIAVGGVGLLASMYALKKSISEENWIKFKDYCITNTKAFAKRCFDGLPSWVQGIILFLKDPCTEACDWIIMYGPYFKRYVAISAVCAMGGHGVGWPVTGYLCGGATLGYGFYAVRFDRMEHIMKEHHKEAMDAISGVQDQIKNLGQGVDVQIAGVSEQITNVQDGTDKIKEDIAGLKEQLENVDAHNQQSVIQLKERINGLEISLNKKMEEQIDVLSCELKKEMTTLKETEFEQANAIQKNINSLTELVNDHKLTNAQQLQEMSEVFSEKLKKLGLTLKEDILKLYITMDDSKKEILQEVQTNRQDILKELLGVTNDMSMLKNKLEGHETLTCQKMDKIIDDTGNVSEKVKSLKERAVRIEEKGDELGKQLKNQMSELGNEFLAVVTSINTVMDGLKNIETKQENQKNAIENISKKQAVDSSMLEQLSQNQEKLSQNQKEESEQRAEDFKTLKIKYKKFKTTVAELKELVSKGQQEVKKEFAELKKVGDTQVDRLMVAINSNKSHNQIEDAEQFKQESKKKKQIQYKSHYESQIQHFLENSKY